MGIYNHTTVFITNKFESNYNTLKRNTLIKANAIGSRLFK